MNDKETYAPLSLFEYDHRPGSYCLMLTDAQMGGASGVFAEHGLEESGYGWAGVARAVLARDPGLENRLGLDPEAGMFVAYGDDLDALRTLAASLHEAIHDHAKLSELIKAGDPEWFD
ncbi:immunity 51 family protein [Actinomadura atramentaria]|uniref:immunity 51 family protein n=1 Tax=Actinomadura atramentaria TaxID=1990 RepID=UPI00035EC2F2|nr:immunity 51 family protein [Actinomadura atramentaria]